MKIYEKPMAIINKFEVVDVIAASEAKGDLLRSYVADANEGGIDNNTQGVVFAW